MNTAEDYDRFMQRRYGVSKKDLKIWRDEYLDDVRIGAIEWNSKCCLKMVNSYLNDIKLVRKYRICENYRKINDRCFEGMIKSNGQKIRVEKRKPIKRTDKCISIHIDDIKMFECVNQKQAIDWIKNYLELKNAI